MRKLRWLTVALVAVGAVACGSDVREAEAPRLTGDELANALQDADILLLDVRSPEELEELGTVEGYVNIPIDELASRLDELPRDRPILTA